MERIEITENLPDSRPFRFKKFTIYQDRCAMKVGTDGVLLGAWVETEGYSRILDIGTGTGLLALMVAQRNPSALIDALEVDVLAFEQAQENFSRSPWAGRLNIYHSPVQQFRPAFSYEMIVCNPPFYTHSPAMPDSPRKMARLADNLTPEILLDNARGLLTPNGLLQVILPIKEGKKFAEYALNNGWYLKRRTLIKTKPHKPVSRQLIALSPSPLPGFVFEDELIIQYEATHDYTEEFRRLLYDFYIIFD
ncbi:MAG: methyltransferase [Bacteroidia bacterium]|nr:methyltransferase [Bacteroidia bacterium]